MRRIVVVASAALAIAACGRVQEEKHGSCKASGCPYGEGITVDFTEAADGEYRIDGDTDGEPFDCNASLPRPDGGAVDRHCSRSDVYVMVTNAVNEAGDIRGLGIHDFDVKSVTIRVRRDGQLVRESTFVPPYIDIPDWGGPGCGTCRSATIALPDRP